MPRIQGLILRPHDAGATASFQFGSLDVAVELRRRRRSIAVAWPRGCKVAPSHRRRVEPHLRRAMDQWGDLAGGAG